MSERLACKAVGLSRSTHRRLPAGPDTHRSRRGHEGLAACLRHQTPVPWVPARLGGVAPRRGPGGQREEGAPAVVRGGAAAPGSQSPRKRAGTSSVPQVVADAPKVVWAIDFQFDSTTDGKAIKIASMVDEHTRESLLHFVERSITAERLVDRTRGGVRDRRRAAEGSADGQRSGVGFPSAATVLRGQGRACPTFRRAPRGTTATSNHSTTGYGRSASTATTGPPCSRPGWSSATSRTSTTTDTGIRPWATEHRPSTLPDAATPTTPNGERP